MKKFLKATLLITVLTTTFTACEDKSKSDELVDKQLTMAANTVNKQCPFMVDKVTRLDNTIAIPGKIFQYNYTIINISKKNLDAKKFVKIMKPNLLNAVKTNPQVKIFRDNNVTMSYLYKDKDGKVITKIDIKPEDYK